MTVWHTREYKIIVFPTWQFKIPQRCPSETVLISIIHGFHCTRCGFCYMAEWGEVSFNIDCASFFDTFNLKMKSFHNYYITVVTPFSVSVWLKSRDLILIIGVGTPLWEYYSTTWQTDFYLHFEAIWSVIAIQQTSRGKQPRYKLWFWFVHAETLKH